MFCPNCGAQQEDGHAFCCQCGAHFDIPEQPVPAPKKKFNKKVLFGAIAGVTALALGIGAVSAYLVSHPKVYLRTKVTKYDEEGEWAQTIEYQYNDQGSPTEIVITSPDFDHHREIVDNIEVTRYEPNGGKQVRTKTYEYNDEGHCLSYEDIYERYDEDGELLETKTYESDKAMDYKYDYNRDGTIDTVDQRGITADGTQGEYIATSTYHYDDDGRLVEISNKNKYNEYESVHADFRYDEDGRLTVSTARYLEAMRLCEYEYDRKGNLESVFFSYAPCQAAFDDEHITDLHDYGTDITPSTEAKFQYDSRGRVVSREICDEGETTSEVKLKYSGKHLSYVEFEKEDHQYAVTIVGSEKKAQSVADGMDDDDVAMVRDRHGNIIKAIMADGSYAEFEYEAIRLTKQLAQQHSSIMFCLQRIDLFGMTYLTQPLNYAGGCGLYSYVAYPTNELYHLEVVLGLLNGTIKC